MTTTFTPRFRSNGHHRNGNGMNGNGRNTTERLAVPRIPTRFLHRIRLGPARFWRASDATTVALSFIVSISILFLFLIGSEECRHWFVVPVLACGMLIGLDAVDWVRGRMNLMDPVGIVGVLGYLNFFVAPLLHVSLNEWMAWITPPPDWREWLGKMGLVDLTGLCVYAFVCRYGGPERARPQFPLWGIRRPWPAVLAALVFTAALQAFVYAHFGGLSGYVSLFEKETDTGKSSFTGWGWIFNISEAFPRLALIGLTLYLWGRRRRPGWGLLGAAMIVFFGLLILFGGLRGLRSNTVWSMFWAAGVIHFCLRPLTRKLIFAGLAAFLGFMVIYAAYKHGGTRDLEKAVSGEETQHGSSVTKVVLWDLSRADVQAFLLYRMSRTGTDYTPAWGRTYLGALALLIPEAIWPERPPTKIQEGTQILWGPDWVLIGKASNLYGLGGEALLNFGPAGVPIVFALFALMIRGVRHFVYRLHPRDGRLFLLPVFLGLCIIGLVCDSDNVLFFLFQYSTAPLMVLLFICRPISKSSYPTSSP